MLGTSQIDGVPGSGGTDLFLGKKWGTKIFETKDLIFRKNKFDLYVISCSADSKIPNCLTT